MHECPVSRSCVAASDRPVSGGFGPLVSQTEAKIEQMLRRIRWRLRAQFTDATLQLMSVLRILWMPGWVAYKLSECQKRPS